MRPAGGNARFPSQLAVSLPIRVYGDIFDYDTLSMKGGGAAGTDAIAYRDPVDGPAIESRQAGGSAMAKVDSIGIQ